MTEAMAKVRWQCKRFAKGANRMIVGRDLAMESSLSVAFAVRFTDASALLFNRQGRNIAYITSHGQWLDLPKRR